MEKKLNMLLPKDLIYIIQDYAKDTTNYNKVVEQFGIQNGPPNNWEDGYWFLCLTPYPRLLLGYINLDYFGHQIV